MSPNINASLINLLKWVPLFNKIDTEEDLNIILNKNAGYIKIEHKDLKILDLLKIFPPVIYHMFFSFFIILLIYMSVYSSILNQSVLYNPFFLCIGLVISLSFCGLYARSQVFSILLSSFKENFKDNKAVINAFKTIKEKNKKKFKMNTRRLYFINVILIIILTMICIFIFLAFFKNQFYVGINSLTLKKLKEEKLLTYNINKVENTNNKYKLTLSFNKDCRFIDYWDKKMKEDGASLNILLLIDSGDQVENAVDCTCTNWETISENEYYKIFNIMNINKTILKKHNIYLSNINYYDNESDSIDIELEYTFLNIDLLNRYKGIEDFFEEKKIIYGFIVNPGKRIFTFNVKEKNMFTINNNIFFIKKIGK